MAARTKVVPKRCTGKVLEWKGTFGWIQPTEPIKHPGAANNNGKVYLSQEDVEADLPGVGATVSFFVYSGGVGLDRCRWLGAMNVRPASEQKGTAVQQAVQKTAANKRSESASAAKAPAAEAPLKGTVALANGGSGERTKVLPNRVTGTVKEWKSDKNFGWIMPDASIAHPSATKRGGKVYLAAEDVEADLSGIGASVSFFVYSNSNGLGAMNVRPATGTKPVSNKPAPPTKSVSNTPAPTPKMKPGQKTAALKATMAMATKMAVQLKTKEKKASVAKKTKHGTVGTSSGRKRITDDAVVGEIKSFGGSFGWIKLTESSVDGVGNKDLYCMKKDVVEGTSTKKGTAVTCHVYKDAKGFGAEEVAEL